MFRRSFLKLDQILPSSIARTKSPAPLQAAWVLRFWPEVIELVANKKEGWKKIKAITFKNNTLTIEVPNTLWANELRLKQVVVRKELNKKIGRPIIHKIRFKLN